MQVSLKLAAVAICCGFLWGCSKATPMKETGSVKGKITRKGTSFPAGTTVTFQGSGAGAATASGSVAADGTFSVTASVGMNQISISPPVKPPMSPEEMMKASEKGKVPETDSAVPAKYLSPSTSGMSIDVKKGDNQFNFDINE